MYSIIVVPPPTPGDAGHRSARLRLAPGERLALGRAAQVDDLRIDHAEVSRRAGAITAPAFSVDRATRCFAVPAAAPCRQTAR